MRRHADHRRVATKAGVGEAERDAEVAGANAKPKLLAGLPIQPFNCVVTSITTYCRASVTETFGPLKAPPFVGVVVPVTVFSVQLPNTGIRSSNPGTPMRLTHRIRLARTTLDELVPADSVDGSKRSKAVEPLPTLSVGKLPKLLAGCAVLTWVLAAGGASAVCADRLAAMPAPASRTRPRRRRAPRHTMASLPAKAPSSPVQAPVPAWRRRYRRPNARRAVRRQVARSVGR